MRGTKPTTLQDQVTRAEALFTYFIVEHNLPFSVGDHLTQLIKTAIPDSKVAEKLQLGHTKVLIYYHINYIEPL